MASDELKIADFVWLGGIAVAAAAAGGVLVWRSRRKEVSPVLTDLGARAFYNLIMNGARDDQVERVQPGGPELWALHKSFSDAKIIGISPTALAVSGRYFGAEVEPVHFDVLVDGRIRLRDEDRNKYEAAKDAGALSILADVVQRDVTGEAVSERRAAVRLL